MRVPGTPNTTNYCFHGAKVSNFYIFGKNETTKKGTHLLICTQRRAFLLFGMAHIQTFFP
jgi:hypothetical protein